MIVRLKRGERLQWQRGAALGGNHAEVWITRVAKDQSWCDTIVYDTRTLTSHTKRLKLPLDPSFWAVTT